jgi:tellurite resistance protein TerC
MSALESEIPHSPRAAPSRARNALIALVCVALGLGFGGIVWIWRGPESAQQYVAGYLIELSLSVDNVFVFALIFAQFALGPAQQRRLLSWGIAGAIILRTAFIVAGVGAISRFSWIIPVLGLVILATGIRLALARGVHRGPNPSGRMFSFVTRHLSAGLAALVIVEAADLVFALDSLPAVLAVTHDPVIAVTSNLFAIIGLRSLFFVVSGAMRSLRFLNTGVAAVLAFVGAKMLLEPWYAVPTPASLAVIAAILSIAVAASLMAPALKKRPGIRGDSGP